MFYTIIFFNLFNLFFAVLGAGNAHSLGKYSGKIMNIFYSDRSGNVSDRHIGMLGKKTGGS